MKINQIGTLTSLRSVEMARNARYLGHLAPLGRDGDSTIADIAVAQAMQIKTGSLSLDPRQVNQLLRIEEELGESVLRRARRLLQIR